MTKAILSLLVLLLVVAAGGAAVLAAWDIPAPKQKIEKVIPNERLAR